MKKVLSLLSTSILFIQLLAGVTSVQAQAIPTGKFLGSYYNGRNFETLAFTRETPEISFGWGWGSPDPAIYADNFSIRWQGNFIFEDADYQFTVRSDDGVRLYIDGNKIIDSWKGQHYATFKAIRRITPGTHLVVLEYFESIQSAAIKAEWIKLSSASTGSTGPTGTSTRPTGTTGGSPTPSLYASLYKSSCEELIVNPVSGEAPLTVDFTAAGYDPYGTIQEYRIDTGDRTVSNSVITTEEYFISYEYKTPGTYTAILTVKDSKGSLLTADACKKKVTVGGELRDIGGGAGPTVFPTATVSALPATGIFDSSYSLVLITIPLAIFGLLLNRKFSKL
ncbi:MAG TPA: PA14 domain-containing protein [Patescibacteria group bacterium]|nr:PA14 domain-containing protein [Patescibacteria group bacterium]